MLLPLALIQILWVSSTASALQFKIDYIVPSEDPACTVNYEIDLVSGHDVLAFLVEVLESAKVVRNICRHLEMAL